MNGNTRYGETIFSYEGSAALKPREPHRLRLVEGGRSRAHGRAIPSGTKCKVAHRSIDTVSVSVPKTRAGYAPNVTPYVSESQTLVVYAAGIIICAMVFGAWLIQRLLG